MASFQSLAATKIDDLNLTFLDIGKVPLTDASLSSTFNFKELRHLNVSDCKNISDRGFVTLAEKNPGRMKSSFLTAIFYLDDLAYCQVPNLTSFLLADHFCGSSYSETTCGAMVEGHFFDFSEPRILNS